MIKLYLIAEPDERETIVAADESGLRRVLDALPGARAYHLGIADQGVPPGAVAQVAQLGRLVMQNVRPVTNPRTP